ncbi:MarR family winged helix-turn-helix transcriptional regulator [Streptomyces apocyni]|uniref:MarR family winged helix-turn-helix transcriptional regulator n=1 Tax=Streptomyces apocyni TaxID=2654677 RepID=UPI0012EA91D5|nr:MarR family transcriptional regulator [Streptomyces apocyni]
MSDAVDQIVGQWASERPDLVDDLWPVEMLGRIQRVALIITKEVKAFTAEHGLEMGEFDVLTTLRRCGAPYTMTAGALVKASFVTSGAITNRIDRMEAKGLVERVRDGADRRSVRIRLTEQGRQVIDVVMGEHLRNYARLAESLDRAEMDQVAAVLRKLLEAHGDTTLT